MKMSDLCSQAKPACPEWLFFAETSTMAPFTAVLTLELQAPLGIQKHRHEKKRITVRCITSAVKTAKVRALLPGETSQHRVVILS